MAFITLEHVVKRYQMGEVTITAVEDVSFTIERGEFAVIVGPMDWAGTPKQVQSSMPT